jgi:hypothetical protein
MFVAADKGNAADIKFQKYISVKQDYSFLEPKALA